MVGYWSEKYFTGKIVLNERISLRSEIPDIGEERARRMFNSFSGVLKFNKSPVELNGRFKLENDKLHLVNVGEILFEDGSLYRGMVKRNTISGYGTMQFATGESYRG